MVTITRSLARLLRAVLRKAGLGKSGSHRTRSSMFRQITSGCDFVSRVPRSPSNIGSPVSSIPLHSCYRSRSWPSSKDARKSQSRSMLPIRAD